jgi:hypothetical protein
MSSLFKMSCRDPLVENMVKNNCSHFPIAVLLTTLICSLWTIAYLFFWFYNCNYEILGARNTLERYFQDLYSGILKAPKFLKFQLVDQKYKFAFVWWLQIKVIKRTTMGKQLRFFFTMCFTSDLSGIWQGLKSRYSSFEVNCNNHFLE